MTEAAAAAPNETQPVNVANMGNQPAPAAPAAPDFATLVPAEYKDKPWVKETKDLGSLFKRTDGLISELGKRPAGIPQENATEAEWATFHKAWGVPEKPEGYTLGEPSKEDGEMGVKFQTGIKGLFHKAGVSPRQAKILEEGYNALSGELKKAAGAAGEKLNTDFDKLKVDVFGARADDAMKGSSALLAKYMPASMKDHVANLSNENLIVLASVIDGIRREFIQEDRMPAGGSAPVGMSADAKRARGQELMASKAYTDPFHPDHEKTKAEVQRLYGTA